MAHDSSKLENENEQCEVRSGTEHFHNAFPNMPRNMLQQESFLVRRVRFTGNLIHTKKLATVLSGRANTVGAA